MTRWCPPTSWPSPTGARLEPVGKRASRPSAKQLQISHCLVKHAAAGYRVVRLKNGDPFVFGRGGEEALALAAASIPFRVVPGISAGVAAPAMPASRPPNARWPNPSPSLPATMQAVVSLARLTGKAFAKGADTLVLYMSLRQIETIAAELLAAGREASEPVAFLTDATTPNQQRTVTTLGEAAAVGAGLDRQGPTLTVIGDVVDLHDILAPLQQVDPARLAMPLNVKSAERGPR